jgi:hypothetical protein
MTRRALTWAAWAIALVAVVARPATGQTTYWKPAALVPPVGGVMAYDTKRGEMLLFGGSYNYYSSGIYRTGYSDQLWAWNGTTWTYRAVRGPSARTNAAMVYDSRRHVMVLFGGVSSSGLMSDTWEWDGTTWSRRAVDGPAARYLHGMAYDSLRGKTVLYGGASTTTSLLADTWEWDGKSWAEIGVTGPPARCKHAMAFDESRGVVLSTFGTNTDVPYITSTSFNGTWAYDGTSWSLLSADQNIARYDHAIAYDPARRVIVMHGGVVARLTGSGADTWEWNGSAWTQIAAPVSLLRARHVMAYDAGRNTISVFGGSTLRRSFFTNNVVQEYDGSAWSARGETGQGPSQIGAYALDAARNELVLFGRASGSTPFNQTWTWDGRQFRLKATGGPSLDSFAMVYDPLRTNVVLCGRGTTYPILTYTWDGTAWTQRNATGPGSHIDGGMAFDSHRGVVMLFAGDTSTQAGAKTYPWEWDGSVWKTGVLPPIRPNARNSALVGYDPSRSVTLMYGGKEANSSYVYSDTWEWDGVAWANRLPDLLINPPSSMAYDFRRGVLAMFGRNSAGQSVAWEWNGAWAERPLEIGGDGFFVSNPNRPGLDRFLLNETAVIDVRSQVTECRSPAIVYESPDQVLCTGGGSRTVRMELDGDGPWTSRWEWALAPLAGEGPLWQPVDDSVEPGVVRVDDTEVLEISGARSAEAQVRALAGWSDAIGPIMVRCVSDGPCGGARGWGVTLRLCRSDLTCDGVVDFLDFLAFFNCLDAGDGCADIDGSPGVGFEDFLAFVDAFDSGC